MLSITNKNKIYNFYQDKINRINKSEVDNTKIEVGKEADLAAIANIDNIRNLGNNIIN